MNILIYYIKHKLLDLILQLQNIKDVSIFFALNETEFFDNLERYHPKLIFIDANSKKTLLQKFSDKNLKINIYAIDESLQKLNFFDLSNHNEMELEKIIKKYTSAEVR
ncbi:MAG: hypothetical protein K8S23_05025 [Candidatus Cloacimonetes bacterium]|nr:hypothetical protein [Candidatus Cloacimonadota bacterium]